MSQVKGVFKITAVAVVANITLNAKLIPVMGILGAAVATLVTMILNAVLARRITLRVERSSLLNIFATVVMDMVLGGYRSIVPLSSV